MSDSSQPHGLQLTRLLHPWDFPGKSTGVGCHCPLQMEYYSAIKRNTTESVLMRWMKLEPIIQSEVSQKVKCKYCMKVKVTQSYLTLCNPMDYTVPGILQARILELVAFAFSRDLLNPGIESGSPALQVNSLSVEPQEYCSG